MCDHKACQTSLANHDVENMIRELDVAREIIANNPQSKPGVVETTNQMCQTEETASFVAKIAAKLKEAQEKNKELNARLKAGDEVTQILLDVRKKAEVNNSNLSDQNEVLTKLNEESKLQIANHIKDNTALTAAIQKHSQEKTDVLAQLEEANRHIKNLVDKSYLATEQKTEVQREANALKSSYLGLASELANIKASECDKKYQEVLLKLRVAMNFASLDRENNNHVHALHVQLEADYKKAKDENNEILHLYESMKENIEQADLLNLPKVKDAQISDEHHAAVQNIQEKFNEGASVNRTSLSNPALANGISHPQRFPFSVPNRNMTHVPPQPHNFPIQRPIGHPGNHPLPFHPNPHHLTGMHIMQLPPHIQQRQQQLLQHQQRQQMEQHLWQQQQQQQHLSLLQLQNSHSASQRPSVDINNPNLITDLFGDKGTGLPSGTIQSAKNLNVLQPDATNTTAVNVTRPKSLQEETNKSTQNGEVARIHSSALDEAANLDKRLPRDSKSFHALPKLQNVLTDYPSSDKNTKDIGSNRLLEELKKRNPSYSLQELQKCIQSLQSTNQLSGKSFSVINTLVAKELEDKSKAKKNAWGLVKSEVPAWKPDSVQDECSICIEKMTNINIQTLDCQHSFHQPCIKTWLQMNSVCPMCYRHVKLSDEYPPLK